MTVETAHSKNPNPHSAVQELKQQLGPLNARFLLYFVSSHYDVKTLGEALRGAFDCPSIGCTTAGEIAGGKLLNGSVVLMAFDDDHLEAATVARVPDNRSESDARHAYTSLIERMGSVSPDEGERLVGLVLHDGMSGGEEALMATLSSLSNIPFIGGSAGDDERFQQTHVFVGGEPFSGGAALALLKLKHKHAVLKTQSFDVTEVKLLVTRADETTRRVLEFNGKPAAEEYARAVGCSAAELPKYFQSRPLGLLVGESEPFVRSPQQVQGTHVLFYCQVKEGMELRLLKSRGLVEQTQSDLKRAIDEFGPVRGLVNFNCIQRTLELEQTGRTSDYAKLFEPYTTIGFSTYGESYIGHINQTSLILLLA